MDERRSKGVVRRANHLLNEKSPYLSEHAYNPVDWYPWGQEAFEKAKLEDRPIFLSIGYSTCHWCHVFAAESFEDPRVAELMNETFVCIKVDREERPDVDGVYMAACQAMTGGGGWPLTIVMTPEGKPFFAATYIPKESALGRPGMMQLIPRIGEMWAKKKGELRSYGEEVASSFRTLGALSSSTVDDVDGSILKLAYGEFTQRFDEGQGGFGTAPKFPALHNVIFLLRYWRRSGNVRALRMAERTLMAIREGGVYDQLGFGVHRYSTDAFWLVPHFEKMLYDQALAVLAYCEAYGATTKGAYARVAKEVIAYVLRDLRSEEGAFFSAEDADSEGEEGKFYLWTEEQIREALGPEDAGLAIRAYGVEERGNFVDPTMHVRRGVNVLHFPVPVRALAKEFQMEEEPFLGRLESIRVELLRCREGRMRPRRDEKILVDWNGLTIGALARASQVLGEATYAQAARRAADFILENMFNRDGRLLHTYIDGVAAVPALLDDYAFFAWGLLELYEATFEATYLRRALEVNGAMVKHFWDSSSGGFFFTPDDGERLLARLKTIQDGAAPSGNSVAVMNLLKLAHITGDSSLEEMAMASFKAFYDEMMMSPSSSAFMLTALDYLLGPSLEVVVAGDLASTATRDMVDAIRKEYAPNKVLLLRDGDDGLSRIAPFTKNMVVIAGRPTAYVCSNGACDLPTHDVSRVVAALRTQVSAATKGGRP